MSNSPIGIFDSGVGGLILFSQLEHYLPNETLYYLADTAHFPYGNKSQDEIIQYSLQNTAFLLDAQVKLIVIACFTASSIAYDSILSHTDIPVISVVESLIEELERQKSSTRVALLGTKATIQSGIVQKRLSDRGPWSLFPMVGSELVQSIEKRDEGQSRVILMEYRDYFKLHNIDTVMLACTHFAHILPLMKELWGEDIAIVEGSAATALKITDALASNKNPEIKSPHRVFSTGSPLEFQKQAESFVQVDVEAAHFGINLAFSKL